MRVVDTVGGEFSHLVDGGVANDLVLEGDGQHLVRTEGLVEGDESELGVVGVLVAVQQAGTFHFLVVGTGCESGGLHMGGDVVNAAYGRGVEDFKQVVAAVGGTLGAPSNQAAVGGEVFAQVGEGKDVAVVGHGGSHIGAPHFHADNLDVGVGRGEGGHGFVVVVVEVLSDKVVAVFFILVGTDLEFLRGGAALHAHVLGAGLFLRHDGVDGQFAELELGVDAEQLLAAVDEGGVEGEGDVGGLEELQDVVFLAFVFEFYLVFEIEGGLGVPVDVEVEEVSNLCVEVDLDVLVEVEGGDTAAVCVDIVVVAVVVDYLEGEVGAAGGVDGDIGDGQQTVDFLADFAEAGYAAQQAVVGGRVAHG